MLKSNCSSRKVVFFFPSFASSDATAPLGILAVATPLIHAGYQVALIDSTITLDYKKRVLEECRDALCLGISLVTGPMIRETVEIARAIKDWNPEFPVILGGWHPSLLPQQTLEAPYIDYVVRRQGEDSMLELVDHLSSGSAPDLIAGIGFKRDNKTIFTPERPLKPLVDMPPKAYHLADFDAYERVCGKRWAMYTSSLACPYNCGYCTNAGVYGRNGMRCRRNSLSKKPSTSVAGITSRCCGSLTTTSWLILIVHAPSLRAWFVKIHISSGAFRRQPTSPLVSRSKISNSCIVAVFIKFARERNQVHPKC